MAESEKTPERSPESAQLDEAAIRRLQDDLPDDEVLWRFHPHQNFVCAV